MRVLASAIKKWFLYTNVDILIYHMRLRTKQKTKRTAVPSVKIMGMPATEQTRRPSGLQHVLNKVEYNLTYTIVYSYNK